jgi:hypothetical protein
MTPLDIWRFSQWVGIIAAVAATVGGLIAGFKAVAEWNRSTLQRREELNQRERQFRHDQAVFSRDLIKDIFNDLWARSALRMLDWDLNNYEDSKGVKYEVSRSQMKSALRVDGNMQFSEEEVFIRTCFESLYDYLEQVENLIQLKIVNFEDIETTFRYYMVREFRPDTEHFDLLRAYDYPRAELFILRFRDSFKAKEMMISIGS